MKRFIQNDWWDVLKPQFKMPYYQKLRKFLVEEYTHHNIHPKATLIYEAFKLTPFNKVKVVILGQDPYHEPHQGMGLSFSVMPGVTIPPSLRNVYKELYNDLGIPPVNHGCLIKWTQEGVLLLNSVLTVREGHANSHKGHGWEKLTNYAIQQLSNAPRPIIFILWGKVAQAKQQFINRNKNVVIEAPHPSPFSARYGFFGSKPFSKTNYALKVLHERPIDWQLPKHVSLAEAEKELK